MKALRVMFLIAALAVSGATMASANDNTSRVDRRQHRQHVRIRQGVANGRLSPAERMRLRAGQAHVRRVERRAKRDHNVTLRERRHMNHAQNFQSRRIWRLKHNGRWN